MLSFFSFYRSKLFQDLLDLINLSYKVGSRYIEKCEVKCDYEYLYKSKKPWNV